MDPGSQDLGCVGQERQSADLWCLFSSPPRFTCGTGVKSAQDWWSSIAGQSIRWLSGCWTRSCKSAARRRRCGWPSCRAPFPRCPFRSREPRCKPTGLSPGTLMSQKGLCAGAWALKIRWVVRSGVGACSVLRGECRSPRRQAVKMLVRWDTERGAGILPHNPQCCLFFFITLWWVQYFWFV